MMISREKNSAGPTSIAASTSALSRGVSGAARSRCLCAFSIITIAASTIAPMAIAMPPRLMMLELMPKRVHGDERHQHAHRQHDDGDQRRADVQQEDDADDGDDDALLDQRALASRWPA